MPLAIENSTIFGACAASKIAAAWLEMHEAEMPVVAHSHKKIHFIF